MNIPSIQFKGKLTETKALKLSLDLWSYLSVTGKGKPFKFIESFTSGCPLCSYDLLTYDDKDNDYCQFDCPLRGGDPCHRYYESWFASKQTNNIIKSKFYANKIKNILQKAYNKIK